MTDIQEKRNSLELTAFFHSDMSPIARAAIIQSFESMLGDYMLRLLDPSLEVDQAMWVRAKAIGIVETLTKMGVNMTTASQAFTKPAKKVVGQALNVGAGY